MPDLTRPQKLKSLEELFHAVGRLAGCFREWDRMLDTIERQERLHRSGHGRIGNLRSAVHYFACKCILERIATPPDWQVFVGFRADYALGQAMRVQLCKKPEGRKAVAALLRRWKALGVDYCGDIAGKV